MRYILGYFALMLAFSGFGALASGKAVGFLLIALALVLVYVIVRLERERRRARRFGDYVDAIDGYDEHFAKSARALEAKLPEDALDSPALVELLSAEAAEEGEAIRSEYARLRERFLAWQREVESMHEQKDAGAIGLPASFAARCEQLDQELTELLEEVTRLEARAADADRVSDNPLEEIARAALKLEEATAVCRRTFGDEVPPELARRLEASNEKLEQARHGLAKGAERPLAAARLAGEVYEEADAVERRAQALAKLPGEIDAQRVELDRKSRELADAIAAVRGRLESAAAQYAPSCLLPIRGFGSSAQQAVDHAQSILAGRQLDAARLEQADGSLTRAGELVAEINRHLGALEEAALEARHDVEEAELELDGVWASFTAAAPSPEAVAGVEPVLARAKDVLTDARRELEKDRPDWFRVLALAKRATNLVEELRPGTSRSPEESATHLQARVELARLEAESALMTARALIGSVEVDNMTGVFLDEAEHAYKKAVALQDQLGGATDPDALAHAALNGFRLAEDAAAAAQEHALGLRAVDGSKSSGDVAAGVVWGTIARAAFKLDF
jgi:hypothetical protein